MRFWPTVRQSLRAVYRRARQFWIVGAACCVLESYRQAIERILMRSHRVRHFARTFWRTLAALDEVPYNPQPPAKHDFPTYAVVEINNTCNINCLMCNTNMAERQKGTMKLELLEKSLRELKANGITLVEAHTIGDPLAHPRLADVLAVFRRVGMPLGLTTNGLLIERHLDTLVKYSDVSGAICLSIDGATKTTYERVRAGGKWEVLLHNLELARSQLEPRGYQLSTHMVLSRENIHEVGLFIELFRRYVSPRRMSFGFVNSLSPDTSYFRQMNLFPRDTYPKVPCSLPFTSFWVHIDGRVSSCCRDYHGELIVGDVKQDRIRDVWDGEAFQRLRNAHMQHDVSGYRLCANCDIVDPRIGEAFTAMMSYLLWQSPNSPAGYYQEWVDRFIDTIGAGRPFIARFQPVSGAELFVKARPTISRCDVGRCADSADAMHHGGVDTFIPKGAGRHPEC